MIQIVRSMASVAPLFAGWQETIIWSCLQGEMGEVYAPVGEAPSRPWPRWGILPFWRGSPGRSWSGSFPQAAGQTITFWFPRTRMGPVHCRGVPPGPPGDPLCHGKDRDAI